MSELAYPPPRFGYSPRQLVKYHRWATAAVSAGDGDTARCCPPGVKPHLAHFHGVVFTANEWLAWFRARLDEKITAGGNRRAA
jgi:hypothetical protein